MTDPATLTSFAVEDPEIPEVLDLGSGAFIPTETAIGSDRDKLMALRMRLAEARERKEALYVCPLCGVPVYLVRRHDRDRFFFRHDLEDDRCPARTRGELSEEEITARKYNGAKESRDHIQLKTLIAASLASDPNFSGIEVEPVVKGRGATRGTWRRPDVRAVYQGVPVAFEIQLSTTFLRVIAGRRNFYLENGGLLCWIFKTYDADRARLTQDDVFYNNNHNLFIASQETLAASRQHGRFTLQCHWNEPYVHEGKVDVRWNGRMAAFDELTIDRTGQRLYLFDYDAATTSVQEEAKAALAAAISAKEEAEDAELRQTFERFWLAYNVNDDYDQDAWADLRLRFDAVGLGLPSYPNHSKGPWVALIAVYSAREGKGVGWKYSKLIQVGHVIAETFPHVLRLFRHALRVYGRADQIKREDVSERWKARVKRYLPLLEAHDPRYHHACGHDRLIEFLFPELHWVKERTASSRSTTMT